MPPRTPRAELPNRTSKGTRSPGHGRERQYTEDHEGLPYARIPRVTVEQCPGRIDRPGERVPLRDVLEPGGGEGHREQDSRQQEYRLADRVEQRSQRGFAAQVEGDAVR